MAYTTINKSDEYFNTKLYTGNDTTNAITGVNFQPDLVWIKGRDSAYNHQLVDVIRGVNKPIRSNLTAAEATLSDSFNSFDSDGFTLGGDSETDNFNNSGQNYVAWNWLANGAGVSNTDGSITSTVSANTTSGFSIVKWTGTGSNATVGHGLGKEVKFFITKRTDSSGDNWYAYHSSLGGTKYLHPNNTSAAGTAISPFNNTNPTSTTISAGTDLSVSGFTHIAYCFSEVKGFSKFGSYVSNANVDGTFVYTGMKPAFLLVKNTSATGNWFMLDNKRNTYNVVNSRLTAEGAFAEDTGSNYDTDFLSNGFKLRTSSNPNDSAGNTYIYMAFAENPLVGTNGVPATAR
jgi:hypothetical protein